MSLRSLRFALWALVAIVGGAMGGVLYSGGFSGPEQATQQEASTIGGTFDLVDHTGTAINQDALLGSPSVIFFGFTHCPEICPTTLHDMAGWLEDLGPEGEAIKSYFVTVDPERDTPEIMNDYVTAFSDRITGITGSPEKVTEILQNYRVFAQKVRLGDGDYTMNHSAAIYLLDEEADFVGTISFGEDRETALQKLKNLAKRSQTG
ncbi:MAG: SCO family protein [Pseudomonadota bacterium]